MRWSSVGTYGSDTAALLCERTFKRNATKRAVIWCHGYNQYPWTPLANPDPLMVALVEAGFPVIVPSLGGISNWGSGTDTLMSNALSQIESALGAKSEAPLIVCYSMGSLAALNWLAHGSPVAAIIGEAPLADFTGFYNNNLGGYQGSIQTAYGGGAAVTSALPTHDPNLQTAAIKSAGTPMKLYYGNTDGTDDGLMPISAITSFATAVGATTESIGNVSHANIPANMPVADAFGFLTTYA